MKRVLKRIGFLVLLAWSAVLPVARAERTVAELSAGWKFIRQDVGLEASAADWQAVSVPAPRLGCNRK